jgi:Domain of unknown function (DUF2437)
MACPERNYSMKLIRFALGGRAQHGSLEGDQIQPLEGELHALRLCRALRQSRSGRLSS